MCVTFKLLFIKYWSSFTTLVWIGPCQISCICTTGWHATKHRCLWLKDTTTVGQGFLQLAGKNGRKVLWVDLFFITNSIDLNILWTCLPIANEFKYKG